MINATFGTYVPGHLKHGSPASEGVLSSIGNLLMGIKMNPELDFHEAILLLNRLEMALSVRRSPLDIYLESEY